MSDAKELSAQLQQTQDMLEGAINQRNAAQNESVSLHGQIKAQARVYEARIADLEAKLATSAEGKAEDAPKPNGKGKANGSAEARA